MTLKRAAPLRRTDFKQPERERSPQPLYRMEQPAKAWTQQPIKPVDPKLEGRVNQAIRDSAKGEECTVRIVGACSFDPARTIWSHAPLQAAGKGGAIKALDICGAYACTACDAVVDGQASLPPGASYASVLADWMMGHLRSLVRLRQKGLV